MTEVRDGVRATSICKPGATPSAEQIAKLAQLGQTLSTAEVQKASAAIAAWSAGELPGRARRARAVTVRTRSLPFRP